MIRSHHFVSAILYQYLIIVCVRASFDYEVGGVRIEEDAQTVLPAPLTILPVIKVLETEPLRIDCTIATNVSENIPVIWKKGRLIISTGRSIVTRDFGERVRVFENRTLEIQNATVDDAGIYTCAVIYSLSENTTMSYRVLVQKVNLNGTTAGTNVDKHVPNNSTSASIGEELRAEMKPDLERHLKQIQELYEHEKNILSRQAEVLESEHLLRKKLLSTQIEYYEKLAAVIGQ